jgi:hypothetical protein
VAPTAGGLLVPDDLPAFFLDVVHGGLEVREIVARAYVRASVALESQIANLFVLQNGHVFLLALGSRPGEYGVLESTRRGHEMARSDLDHIFTFRRYSLPPPFVP